MIYAFFISHWLLCVFFQSLFQHRYAAHRMFRMSPRVERGLHLLTYLAQGASYLSPRGYAILHREHHAFSDTPKDPHSPLNFSNALAMMLDTKHRYDDYAYHRREPEPRFLGGYPEWPLLDRTLGQSWAMRILWGALYTAVYVALATSPWQFLLLPVHFVMGPIHGAIVNWCGHMYGYRSFDNGDASRNTLPIEVVTLGELFQNNHHKYPSSPNFAVRTFEVDPTWQAMRLLARLKLIEVTAFHRGTYPGPVAPLRMGEELP
jgi:stearoyl-CoA desaturase (Delta-9 desaturase)